MGPKGAASANRSRVVAPPPAALVCPSTTVGAQMVMLSATEQMLLSISTSTIAQVSAIPPLGNKFNPTPVVALKSQVISDRLALAGEHLRAGDQLLASGSYRAAISRHYYAMYHAARAVVYGDVGGDDHQKHADLPPRVPSKTAGISLSQHLTDARLLRNQADYDPYPQADSAWEADARDLGVTAASFVQDCEDTALHEGFIT